MADRPNFLLFVTDQQRADHLSCAGNAVLRTPHIDGIAERGTAFDRFYVANPICMPNRASLMTGRLPSLHGVRSNGIPLSRRARTFVEELAANGYATALVGKSHLQNMTGLPREFEPPGAKADPSADGADREAERYGLDGAEYESENSPKWKADPSHRVRTPFYGFEHVDLCTLHGDRAGGAYEHWLRERHPDPDGLRGPANAIPDDRISTPQAWRTRIPEELYSTSYVADKTVAFIEKRAAAEDAKPFYLQCSFPDPHHPFTPPGRYWDMYDPEDVPLPASFGKGESPILRFMRDELQAGTAMRAGQIPYAVTEREAREAIALTYGMIAMIDDAVGRILGALDRLGLAGSTVVLFTSDHGDFMGDHGILLKGPLHYQGTLRTPFLWADPEARGVSRTAALGSTIDISTTVLERAGIAPYYGIQGRSLLGVVAGTEARVRDAVLVEDDRERIYLGFDRPQRIRTMVTDGHRLTRYHPFPWAELFDLRADPLEIENLWERRDARPVRDALTARMLDLMIEMHDWTPLMTGMA